MIRQCVATAIFLNIVACATSGPESKVSVAQADTSTTSTDPVARKSEGDDPIEDVDAPKIPRNETVSRNSAIVCTKERITGSHRLTKVCRTRSEIESRRTADQDMIRKVQRTPVGAPSPD